MHIQCHCAAVRIALPGPPDILNPCKCSICRRYGALWAYYDPAKVTITGDTDTYIRGDRMIAFHRCRTCGVLTHWSHLDGGTGKIGINMNNADPTALRNVPIKGQDLPPT